MNPQPDQQPLYDHDRLTQFRRDLHKHPELSYQEIRTSSKIIEYLKSLGITESSMRRVAKTGIIVDIPGRAPPSGKPFCIAMRADMDGLPIKEKTPEIEHISVTEAAHMCGHDMHVACLLGGASKLMEKIDQIPSDKTIRLLFQPAEECFGGAFPMIQEGALIGVDEVYGFHNRPAAKPGKMFMKSGFVMARTTGIHVTIYGKGGHSSMVDQLNDPLQAAMDVHVGLRGLIQEYKDKGEVFVLSIPCVKSSDAPNAISDTCKLWGSLRSYSDEFTMEFCAKLKKLIEEICLRSDCRCDVNITISYPAVCNHEKETEHVIKVGKKVFGEENVSQGALPIYASEDFSYYLKERPGAFFFLSSAKKMGDILHTDKFDANDDLIPFASEMWLRLAEDRFGLKFNGERECV